MKFPPFLTKGDKIGIVSTARKISSEELSPAIEILEKDGYEVVLGQNIYARDCQFAGTDEQRSSDIQQMMDDKSVKAILFARGGYGTIRIMDKINFDHFVKHPKWMIGYSDVTVIHSYINKHCKVASMHATMPLNFPKKAEKDIAVQSMVEVLEGKDVAYSFDAHPLNKEGKMEGELVGGNLSMLYSLTGTDISIDTRGKILFIEDLDEYLYHIDRMMMNLKRSGMLDNLAGLLIGGMSDMNDNTVPFGKDAEEIIHEHVKDFDYPVCYNFPAGHIDDNKAFVLGAPTTVDAVMEGESQFVQTIK